MSAPRKVEDALTATVHMYEAIGAQTQALIQIKAWAESIAAQLAEDGIYQAQQEAASAVSEAAQGASDLSGSFRDSVEKLQHALEAFTLGTHR